MRVELYSKLIINYWKDPNLNLIYIYKYWGLEPLFLITVTSKKSNIICCTYRYPKMDLNEFKENYLNCLLDILSKENKVFSYWDTLTLTY